MVSAPLDYVDRPVRKAPEIPVEQPCAFPVVRPERISSQFGPRWKATEDRFDFHRGIDFYGNPGEPIFAIADGRVFRAYPEGSRVYPNGGTTLILRHELDNPITLHGREVDRFYSLYLHLEEYLVEQGETVRRGQHVARMGSSGTTRFNHLHFEIRVATSCSLEYQRRHPHRPCAAFGFDPHVHPFLFVDGARNGDVEVTHEEGRPFVVSYHASRGDLNLNEITTNFGVINFNLRTGIEAETTEALDSMEFGWVRVLPSRFSGRNLNLVYRLEFPERPAFVQFTDIHGDGIRREFS